MKIFEFRPMNKHLTNCVKFVSLLLKSSLKKLIVKSVHVKQCVRSSFVQNAFNLLHYIRHIAGPHFCYFSEMAGSALKRLMAEYKQLTLNPPEGIIAGPINEENFFEWEALIMGPEGTCFEGGVFPARLTFPPDYPLSPPKMKFTCEIFHPNIYADGRVCISILHAPGDDPMGYETSAERWSPVQSVEKILLSVVSMLAEPNDESAANVDAAKTWRDDRRKFNEIAERTVRKCLGF